MTIEIGAFEFPHSSFRYRVDVVTAVGLSVCACFCLLVERWPVNEWPSENFVAASAQAHGYKRKSIEIVHPWTSVKGEAGETEAAVGMTIRNSGKAMERLIGARSVIADKVEIRLEERPPSEKPDSRIPRIVVPSKQEIDLKPSAVHVRLIGLRKRLVAYDTLPVTLIFEKAGSIDVDILVEEEPE